MQSHMKSRLGMSYFLGPFRMVLKAQGSWPCLGGVQGYAHWLFISCKTTDLDLFTHLFGNFPGQLILAR